MTHSISKGIHGIKRVSSTEHSSSLLDKHNSLWVKGTPPEVGTVLPSDQFTKLFVKRGCDMTNIVTGQDFSAAICVKRIRYENGILKESKTD